MDLNLEEFLTGVFAVLAFEGKTKLIVETGVIDLALAQTLDLLEKQMARERIRPQFRLARDAASKPGGALRKALKELASREILVLPAKPGETGLVAWSRDAAYGWLSDTTIPIGFLQRAGQLFWKQHETARIRWSLHELATRRRQALSQASRTLK